MHHWQMNFLQNCVQKLCHSQQIYSRKKENSQKLQIKLAFWEAFILHVLDLNEPEISLQLAGNVIKHVANHFHPTNRSIDHVQENLKMAY